MDHTREEDRAIEARQGIRQRALVHYSMKGGRPFFVAGLWSDAPDHATGEIADSYTMVIDPANAVMRVRDRMPAIPGTDAARRWLEPGPLPAELLVPYPAEEMQAWRVSDDAKSSRTEPHPDMAVAGWSILGR